jgi:hypothetical protein
MGIRQGAMSILDYAGWQEVKYGLGNKKFSLIDTELLPIALLRFSWVVSTRKARQSATHNAQ